MSIKTLALLAGFWFLVMGHYLIALIILILWLAGAFDEYR